jgi:hypothetical protein
MADKPVDTEGARADLGFGNQYFDRWFKQKSSEQKEETFSLVLKYIEEARKKDPSVTLEVKSEKGEVKQVTPDSLAAAMYLAHGSYEAFKDQTAAGRLRGREHLHKSIAILPMPEAFADLARAYISEGDRAKALEIANTGQQQYPESFEIRQVMDMMKSDEKLGAKPTNRRVVMFVLGFLLFLGGWVVLWVADAMRGAQPMSRSIFIVAGAGWVLGILCLFLGMRRVRHRNNPDCDAEDRPPIPMRPPVTRRPLLALSGHGLVRCTCLLLTDSVEKGRE